MLSAKSPDGKSWLSGSISDPKSRSYSCPICREEVSYVSSHLRSGRERVIEHFRHGSEASHTVRKMSQKQGEALEFILAQLSQEYEIELFTDRVYPTSRGDLATDILAREHFPGGKYLDTLIQVDADPFNFNDYLALQQTLTRQGIHFMPVLCAQGARNPNGAFFKDEYRPASNEIIKRLSKNEKVLYDRLGFNIYFDHDQSALLIVKFSDYFEELPEDIFHPDGYVIKQAGETIEFELKKKAQVLLTFKNRFKLEGENRAGKLIALPRPLTLDDYFQKEQLAKEKSDEEKIQEFNERISIMLEGCSEAELKKLTQMYGEEALGGYAK